MKDDCSTLQSLCFCVVVVAFAVLWGLILFNVTYYNFVNLFVVILEAVETRYNCHFSTTSGNLV